MGLGGMEHLALPTQQKRPVITKSYLTASVLQLVASLMAVIKLIFSQSLS